MTLEEGEQLDSLCGVYSNSLSTIRERLRSADQWLSFRPQTRGFLGAPFLAGAIKRSRCFSPQLFVYGGHATARNIDLIGRFRSQASGEMISMSSYAALLLLPSPFCNFFRGIVDELGHVGRFRCSTVTAETLQFVSNGAFFSSSAWVEKLPGKGEDFLGGKYIKAASFASTQRNIFLQKRHHSSSPASTTRTKPCPKIQIPIRHYAQHHSPPLPGDGQLHSSSRVVPTD